MENGEKRDGNKGRRAEKEDSCVIMGDVVLCAAASHQEGLGVEGPKGTGGRGD